jgi:SH3-like domain-containing protein
MALSESRVVVRERYAAQYTDPIAFRCGDVIHVGLPDPVFAEWFWCQGRDGKEGWVHRSFLSQTTGQAIGISNYSARELTVSPGEAGQVIRALDGWVFLELQDGRAGWVPEKAVEAA